LEDARDHTEQNDNWYTDPGTNSSLPIAVPNVAFHSPNLTVHSSWTTQPNQLHMALHFRKVGRKQDRVCMSYCACTSLSHHTVLWGDTQFTVCHFFCMVTDFSVAETDRGVKVCMRVGLLSGQVFSPLVNFGSRGVTGAALLSGMYVATDTILGCGWTEGWWGSRNCGRRRCLRPYGGICILQAC